MTTTPSHTPALHVHEGPEEHDLGLQHDLPTLASRERSRLGRRGLLGLLGGLGAGAVAGCSALASDETSRTDGPSGGSGQPGEQVSQVEVADGEIPEETAGPFPGDGSNGVNVLTESGIVRSDLRSSFGSASGVAEGITTTVRLTVYDLEGTDVTPLAGAAIYLWHCDRDGAYSLYDDAVLEENYLRGVQETDADGLVEFTTIFPAAYAGRWPHMHFEVYPSLQAATSAETKLRTSQLALPQEACDAVYATPGYETSVANMAQTTLSSDNVFGDGYSLQLASVTGSVEDGYVVSLKVPV